MKNKNKGKKGTIVNTGDVGVFTYFVNIDEYSENSYPFLEEEVEIL